MASRLAAFLVTAIVAATVIAGFIVGAQRDDGDGPVDLIVHNGVVYAADESRARPAAVAVRGNRVLRVGSTGEILRLRRPQTTVVDARSGTIAPGFNDAHVHFVSGGLGLERVN